MPVVEVHPACAQQLILAHAVHFRAHGLAIGLDLGERRAEGFRVNLAVTGLIHCRHMRIEQRGLAIRWLGRLCRLSIFLGARGRILGTHRVHQLAHPALGIRHALAALSVTEQCGQVELVVGQGAAISRLELDAGRVAVTALVHTIEHGAFANGYRLAALLP